MRQTFFGDSPSMEASSYAVRIMRDLCLCGRGLLRGMRLMTALFGGIRRFGKTAVWKRNPLAAGRLRRIWDSRAGALCGAIWRHKTQPTAGPLNLTGQRHHSDYRSGIRRPRLRARGGLRRCLEKECAILRAVITTDAGNTSPRSALGGAAPSTVAPEGKVVEEGGS
jgi:hypothetical protein